jgi:hypothetical protein
VLTALAVLLALLASAVALRRREAQGRAVTALRLTMIGAFSIGTCTHVENGLRAGLVPLPLKPLAFNLFWTSLTLLDPLAAILLVVRPRFGLLLSGAIMAADVSVNALAFRPTGVLRSEWPFWLQVAFAVFVFSAGPYCWRRLGRTRVGRLENCGAEPARGSCGGVGRDHETVKRSRLARGAPRS